jgi:pimeloyl-ACP methyl ester carboxylesterase
MFDRRQVLASMSSTLAVSAASMVSMPQAAQAQNPAIKTMPLRFESEGVSLSGGLYLPPAASVGGLVLVHGGGPTPRMESLARLLAQSGFAVVAYDKRGVGHSGGIYEEANNTSPENLSLLARDAAAAMRTLRSHPQAKDLKAGYWGASQAGWVVPLAVAKFETADFFVLWSGPVCTVTEEMEAGIGTGGNFSDDDTARNFIRRLRAEGRDTDPRDSLRGLSIPGLWVYGGRDETLPVALSIERLQGLIDQGQVNFAYWLDSAARHFDLQNSRPFLQATTQWMLEHVARS